MTSFGGESGGIRGRAVVGAALGVAQTAMVLDLVRSLQREIGLPGSTTLDED